MAEKPGLGQLALQPGAVRLDERAASCPAGNVLSGAIDFVEGRTSQFVLGASLEVGVAAPTDCAGGLDAFLWASPPPAASTAHFFLARPTGDPGYGQTANGETRTVGFGDCP